jgi:hypothetical protein
MENNMRKKDIIKNTVKVIKPWKKKPYLARCSYNEGNLSARNAGWNECLLEIEKKKKKLLKSIT